jgi:hypothetical protein
MLDGFMVPVVAAVFLVAVWAVVLWGSRFLGPR